MDVHPGFELRDYQEEIDHEIVVALQHANRVLLVMATGSGKTVTFCNRIFYYNRPTAVIVHRKEIIKQISLTLGRMGVLHRLLVPPTTLRMIRRAHLKEIGKSYINSASEVGVGSVQTITSVSMQRDRRFQSWVRRVQFAVFDEAHHYVVTGRWGQALEIFGHAKILGVTATPERSDGKGLGAFAHGFAEKMILGPSSLELIERGYLTSFRYHAPSTDLDFDNLPVTNTGDINTREMRKRIEKSHLVGDVVEHYLNFAKDLPTIVFANDVLTATEIESAFTAVGVSAVALSAKTDDAVREKEVNAFANGTGKTILINVDLFDEGFDVSGAAAVILARTTFSVAKYLQMVGRILRPEYAKGYPKNTDEERLRAIAEGTKPVAVVIDPVSNWERCGFPTWPRAWSLYDVEKNAQRSKKQDTTPQKVCQNFMCVQPYPAYKKVCPYCGHAAQSAKRSNILEVDGDLEELDVRAMNSLFAKLKRANMSDREFQEDQVKRRVPMLGRQRELRNFKAAKKRRAVLKELMAWWMGLQPDRPKSELQRRFFHRFGVDVVTALTLDEKRTDELIERITEKFTDDVYGQERSP
jgi:superfamily II DNA or RNA helicase